MTEDRTYTKTYLSTATATQTETDTVSLTATQTQTQTATVTDTSLYSCLAGVSGTLLPSFARSEPDRGPAIPNSARRATT